MSGKVLILGASGRFGRHAAEAFWNAGWQVREFHRGTDDLIAVARDVDVIVNAWNPPYPDWANEVPALTQQVVTAAQASGATVIIPGNVYVFGDGSGPELGLETPKAAQNPLGRIRIEMEAAYRAAGVRTIILRAGDFIDTEASGNWFDMIITAGSGKGRFVAPGNLDVPHAWAFLPDLARAAVELAEKRQELASFEEVLFPGYRLSLRDLAQLVEAATGKSQRLTKFNWWMLRFAAPFWRMGRCLVEMRYLWDMPHWLSDASMKARLPRFRETEPSVAIRQAVAHLDIDPDQPVTRSASDLLAD